MNLLKTTLFTFILGLSSLSWAQVRLEDADAENYTTRVVAALNLPDSNLNAHFLATLLDQVQNQPQMVLEKLSVTQTVNENHLITWAFLPEADTTQKAGVLIKAEVKLWKKMVQVFNFTSEHLERGTPKPGVGMGTKNP